MPFSWNNSKTRRNRFSHLVAHHLQSPKTPPSLLLEPGFPTSLIDLYARFRKPTVKKPNQSTSGDSDITENYDEIIEEEVVVVVNDDEVKTVNCRKIEVKLNYVIVVVLNIMLVAVLIFDSKRFNVGITVSAFVLLLLESVGKRLKSVNLNSKPLFASSVQTATVAVCSEEELESKKEESVQVLIKINHKSSRKAMMKSRIKKLVPKKLRRSSMDSKHEKFYGFKEEAGSGVFE